MKSNRRIFTLSIAATLAMLLLLVACDLQSAEQPEPSPETTVTASTVAATSTVEVAAAPSTPAATDTPEPTATPEPRGGTLTLRIDAPVNGLTPWDLRSRAEEHVADLMYNGLVRLDDTLRPQPDLAQSWTTSPDGRVITFTVRGDVSWHDGAPFAAEDAAWTLNTLRTLTVTNPLLFDLKMAIGDVRVPVSDTVQISLTQPYAPILAALTVPILPRHLLEDRTPEQLAALDFWDEPVGTGPFRVDERNERGITFLRNDTFFRGRPLLDGVALVVAPDPALAATALNDGTLLMAEFKPTEPTTSSLDLAGDLRSGSYPENGWYFLLFNTREGRLFSDRRVREALALSVDVPALVRDVTGGRGLPIDGSIVPSAWAVPGQTVTRTRDLDRARALLDEAGWVLPSDDTVRRNGDTTFEARLFVRQDDERRVRAAELIAAAGAEIGLDITVVPTEFEQGILTRLAPPYSFNLLLSSWVNAPNSAGFPTNRSYDPDDYALFSSERIWRGEGDVREGLRNVGGFANPDYDREASAARETYDPEQRAAAIAAAQQVLRAEYPYLFLWADRIESVLSPQVQIEEGTIALDSPRYLWNIEQWYVR